MGPGGVVGRSDVVLSIVILSLFIIFLFITTLLFLSPHVAILGGWMVDVVLGFRVRPARPMAVRFRISGGLMRAPILIVVSWWISPFLVPRCICVFPARPELFVRFVVRVLTYLLLTVPIASGTTVPSAVLHPLERGIIIVILRILGIVIHINPIQVINSVTDIIS